MVHVTGLILAGGKGKRLGRYKATIMLGDEPLILRPFKVIGQLSKEIVVAYGGERQRRLLKGLCSGALFVADEEEGPLGGLLSGLLVARGEWVLVAPVDAPFVSEELYAELLSRARGKDGSVPRVQGSVNPVVAAYRRDTLLRVGQEVRAGSSKSLREVLSRLTLSFIEEDVLEAMPYGLDCVLDVDTEEDLERARKLLIDPS